MALTYTPAPNLGALLPEFALPATDGKTHRPDDFMQAKILVVVFTCNHCPYAQAARPRLIALHDLYVDQGVQFVAINSNDDGGYQEDSFTRMKEERYDYPFPYLRDESQEAAKAFGAVCTPDIFVFGQDRKLIYRGRLDDHWKDETAVTRADLKEVLDTLLAGEPSSEKQFPSMGCSIKWKS